MSTRKGLEVVAQAKLQSGDYAPFIAADVERLASMLPAARDLATTRNIKMRLIKLTNRVDIEAIVPRNSPSLALTPIRRKPSH
jgi:hypothetical protein